MGFPVLRQKLRSLDLHVLEGWPVESKHGCRYVLHATIHIPSSVGTLKPGCSEARYPLEIDRIIRFYLVRTKGSSFFTGQISNQRNHWLEMWRGINGVFFCSVGSGYFIEKEGRFHTGIFWGERNPQKVKTSGLRTQGVMFNLITKLEKTSHEN